VEKVYLLILGFCMRHRWVVVLLCVGAMSTLKPLAMGARKGFIPIDDKAQFEVTVRLPEGRSLASTELVGERVAREIRGLPDVLATMLTVGDDAQQTPNRARIYVKLTDPKLRVQTQDEI
jgi:multidrug efflux pump subunit AcrB